MMGFGMGMMGGGGFTLIIWILLIVGIIYFFSSRNNSTNNSRQSDHTQRENRAVEIAKERYAKGEINKDELEEILKDLR